MHLKSVLNQLNENSQRSLLFSRNSHERQTLLSLCIRSVHWSHVGCVKNRFGAMGVFLRLACSPGPAIGCGGRVQLHVASEPYANHADTTTRSVSPLVRDCSRVPASL